jgi:hypothetical protein
MNCPLCNLINRLTKHNEKIILWKSKVKGLKLTGKQYISKKEHNKRFKDVVLYFDKDFLFVRSLRNKSKNREFIVCIIIKHINKKEFRTKKYAELLRRFDELIIKFVSKKFSKFNKSVRVVENFGSLASVPNHAHKQIYYTITNNLYLKYYPVKYE